MSLWSGSSLVILQALHLGTRSVSEIVRETGLSQSNVSNHLARLRHHEIVTCHRVGKRVFYALTDYALSLYVQNRCADRAAPSPGDPLPSPREPEAVAAREREAYLAAIVRGETDAALRAVGRAVAGGLSWQEVYLELFRPALAEVGRLWQAGQLRVSQEHVATALTERIMGLLARVDRTPWLPQAGTVIVACVEGEPHALGARMVADFFTAAGWSTHFLGASVPTDDLVAFARILRPDVIALSATLPKSRDALHATAARLRRSPPAAALSARATPPGPRPLILAGGQALTGASLRDPGLFDLIEQDPREAVRKAARSP